MRTFLILLLLSIPALAQVEPPKADQRLASTLGQLLYDAELKADRIRALEAELAAFKKACPVKEPK